VIVDNAAWDVVTGGLGFLGRHLVDRLVADGRRVVVVDVAPWPEAVRGDLWGREGFGVDDRGVRHLRHDLACDDLSALLTKLAVITDAGNLRAIWHLASNASPRAYKANQLNTLRLGTKVTDDLCQLAYWCSSRWDANPRLLFASTSEVYGDPEMHPQPETYRGNVDPVGPRSMYDESKRAGEAFVMAWHRERGLDTRIVRIFNSYGPGMSPDDGRVVSSFIRDSLLERPHQIHGSGRQTRSFCYVDDTVSGLLAVMEHGDHQPYNIGNPSEIPIQALSALIRGLVGDADAPLPDRAPAQDEQDPRRRCPDISRISALGWEARTSLSEGIQATIAWMRGKLVR
jgi:dTDP-glucose 4,6-dehydratase